MAQTDQDDDCVSKKPWSEVLGRSLKLFTFNAAKEGGKSFGRVIFYVILAVIVLMLATYLIDSVTGWFSSWFDFWPFNRAEAVEAPAERGGWWPFGKDEEEVVPVAVTPEAEVKWYCRWNPLC